MLRVVVIRVASLVPTMLLVTMGVFLMIHVAPGSPAEVMLGESATPERIRVLNDSLGLNDPLPTQYLHWMTAALQGDLGTSLYSRTSVTEVVLGRLPVTLALACGAVLLSLVLGIAIGWRSAMSPGGVVDRLLGGFAAVALAIPSFWLGLVLLYVFAVSAGWFPVAGYRRFEISPSAWAMSLVLPVVALGLHSVAAVAKQSRTALLEVLDRPFVRSARARGLSAKRVVWRHAWPSAAAPVIAVVGLQFATMIGGAVVVEQIFSLPGIGSLAVTSTLRRDLPVVQGIAIVSAAVVLLVNLIADVVTAYVNPRIRVN